ncbi:hypothetical protein JMJ77_0008779 [Colletotrichum scovillei]|uniref:Uncharacterized protein n=1 Tax=Colletotrichum scovillei TaxID=1209932 RepID=A0A9P7QQQ9_9PEZI|nr:hypothetical protein JMJ78_0001635 [Colletotrichum scovillei]KAG7041074.1 hypothetical protein JMJ77_0008779 [Colletotrichum scovillei]KAG7061107.1 hypothetical protein JMJ76_0010177 [Colletotrichum scovillei]
MCRGCFQGALVLVRYDYACRSHMSAGPSGDGDPILHPLTWDNCDQLSSGRFYYVQREVGLRQDHEHQSHFL